MKKFFAVLIVIVLVVVTIIVYKYNDYKTQVLRTEQLNKEYENFTNGEILGTSLITLINKAVDSNTKNNITQDEKGLYIENDTTSIRIDVKFIESDDIYQMEKIAKLGSEQFIKNYAAMSFKCTNKQYHEKTNNIKYLLFEQI